MGYVFNSMMNVLYYLPKDSRTDGDMWQKTANHLENNLNK